MKKIIIPLALIVILAIIFGLNTQNKRSDLETDLSPEKGQTLSTDSQGLTLKDELMDIKIPKLELSLPSLKITPADRAWNVFQSYLASAKDHNLANLRLLSHQISDTCNNPEKESECFGLMDSVYFFGQGLKRSDFKNSWSDEKQIAIFTDYINGTRTVLYFTIMADKPKVLGMRFCYEGDSQSSQCMDSWELASQDSDGDGWWDGIEVFFYSR